MFMTSISQQWRSQKVLVEELFTNFSGSFCCGSLLNSPDSFRCICDLNVLQKKVMNL